MMKIKKKDKVIVLSGKDKGKIGIVSLVFRNKYNKLRFAIVDGINIAKKHSRAVPNKNKVGGIISVDMPIECSKLALFCDDIGKSSKVFFKISDTGKKARYFKLNKEVIN